MRDYNLSAVSDTRSEMQEIINPSGLHSLPGVSPGITAGYYTHITGEIRECQDLRAIISLFCTLRTLQKIIKKFSRLYKRCIIYGGFWASILKY